MEALLKSTKESVLKNKSIYDIDTMPDIDYDFRFTELPKIEYNSHKTRYNKSKDTIYMRRGNTYTNFSFFCSEVFHEMIHASGRENRLHRLNLYSYKFYNRSYLLEEFVAEIGACLISRALYIPYPTDKLAVYLARTTCIYHLQMPNTNINNNYLQRNMSFVINTIDKNFEQCYTKAVDGTNFWLDRFQGYDKRVENKFGPKNLKDGRYFH